jgi:hypothetical protein
MRSPFFARRLATLLLPLAFSAAALPAGATILQAPTVTNSAAPLGPTFAAANAVDSTSAEYASQGLGLDTFLEFSFGSPQAFDKIVVINRNSNRESDRIGDFTLTFNGGPLTASVTRFAGRGTSGIHSLGGLFTATTVRLDVDDIGDGDSDNNTGVKEVFFVRTPAGHTPIAATVIGSATPFQFYSASSARDGFVGGGGEDQFGPFTEYVSASLGANAFVDFDLGQQTLVGGFDFFDRIVTFSRITGFDLIFSSDASFGEPEDVVRSYTKSAAVQSDVFAPVPARYVRFDVTSNLGGPTADTGIDEITFYQVPEPGALLSAMGGLGLLLAKRRR